MSSGKASAIDGGRTDLHVDPARGGWVMSHRASTDPMMRHAHRHDEVEINLIVSGWVEYLVGDRRVRFSRRSLSWLLPHQTHRLIRRTPNLHMLVIVFAADLVAEAGRAALGPPPEWLVDPGEPELTRLVGAPLSQLVALAERLADPAVAAARCRLGLAWLLAECWQSYQDATLGPPAAQLHPAVREAARRLHDDAGRAEADDLDALARECGVSRPWLSTIFQQQLGESLTDYRNRQRYYLFCELLSQRCDISTTDAALSAGFGSYAQCFRVVRRHAGLAPRELRAQLRRSVAAD